MNSTVNIQRKELHITVNLPKCVYSLICSYILYICVCVCVCVGVCMYVSMHLSLLSTLPNDIVINIYVYLYLSIISIYAYHHINLFRLLQQSKFNAADMNSSTRRHTVIFLRIFYAVPKTFTHNFVALQL